MSSIKSSENHNLLIFYYSKRLFFSPLLYPLVRVQTYMQSHFTFPVGEKLPTLKESFKLVKNDGGFYKGFSFHFAYFAGILACSSCDPFLGLASVGFLYPLELAHVYAASHGTSHINAWENLKKNLFNKSNYRGVGMNFLSFLDPSGFFFNNIKRNYILRTEGGNALTYRDVIKGLSSSGMLLRGAVPGLIFLMFR